MTFETKYNPGDPVWYMSSNQIREGIIEHVKSITVDNTNIPPKHRVAYSLKGAIEATETVLFESKAHLISHLAGIEL
jgi:hypothetical protein